MRSVSSAVLLFALWTGTIAQPTNPYVGYSFFETRRTESDHREIMTQIFLTADDYVGYRYLEDVYGSTNPTVRSVEFSNEHRRKATAQEQADLVQALLAAKVFELTDDPKPASYDYSANLDVRIGGKEVRAYFHSPPQAPGRKGVHDIMLRFARQMKIDQPEDPVTATTISEGDRQPPRVVTLADVLAHPDDYHGKRVSVVGYYHVEFESSNLAVDRAASWGPDVKRSVGVRFFVALAATWGAGRER